MRVDFTLAEPIFDFAAIGNIIDSPLTRASPTNQWRLHLQASRPLAASPHASISGVAARISLYGAGRDEPRNAFARSICGPRRACAPMRARLAIAALLHSFVTRLQSNTAGLPRKSISTTRVELYFISLNFSYFIIIDDFGQYFVSISLLIIRHFLNASPVAS
jgi:hypothetical protein